MKKQSLKYILILVLALFIFFISPKSSHAASSRVYNLSDFTTGQTLTTKQQAIIVEALKYQNVPYVWGGKTPSGFDCSGLIQFVYQQAVGVTISSPTTNQERMGIEVSLNQLQPGDILFWGIKGQSYHDAIYLGNNKYIHAPEPGDVVKVVDMQWFKPDYARRILTNQSSTHETNGTSVVYRVYNPNSGLHHYTLDFAESRLLISYGWRDEGQAFITPNNGTPVYRLYNSNNGMHHYTINESEALMLSANGWQNEGIAWYSAGSVPVYRLFNPNAHSSDSHHFTTSLAEKNHLVSIGWQDEGIAWYAVA